MFRVVKFFVVLPAVMVMALRDPDSMDSDEDQHAKEVPLSDIEIDGCDGSFMCKMQKNITSFFNSTEVEDDDAESNGMCGMEPPVEETIQFSNSTNSCCAGGTCCAPPTTAQDFDQHASCSDSDL